MKEGGRMANNMPGSSKRKMLAPVDDFLRRIMDLMITIPVMILFCPFYIVLVLLIKHDSPGPAVVKEERVGKDGRVFSMWKFRTSRYTIPPTRNSGGINLNGQRTTSLGNFLQETKIDEIPKLWNVLMGDISLVGPHPEDPKSVNEWPEETRREILAERPGLTSPVAVLFTYYDNLLQSQNVKERSLFDILPTRHRLNQIYLRKRTFLTDLDILFWTALSLLPRLHSATFPENLQITGPFRYLFDHHVFSFIGDLLGSFLAVVIAGSIIPLEFFQMNMRSEIIGLYLLLALIYSLGIFFSGSRMIKWEKATASDSLDIAIPVIIVTLLLFIVNLILPARPLLTPAFLLMSGIFVFIGFVVLRYRERLFAAIAAAWVNNRKHGLEKYGEAVLIVGGGEVGRFSIRLLREGPLAYAFNVVGVVDDDLKKKGSIIEGVKVIGTTQDIPELVKLFDIGLVFFSINEIDTRQSGRIASLCRRSDVRMITVPDMMNQLLTYLPKDEGEQVELIGAVLQDSTHDRLTGAYNLQSFIRHVDRTLSQSMEHNQPCSLIAYEVNYHWPDGAARSRAVTSQVLQVVAERTIRIIREVDIFGRIDENKFAVLLPGLDGMIARRLAERLQKQLTSTPVWTNHGPLNINLIIGVTSQSTSNSSAESFLSEAQQRMQIEKSVERTAREDQMKPSRSREFIQGHYER